MTTPTKRKRSIASYFRLLGNVIVASIVIHLIAANIVLYTPLREMFIYKQPDVEETKEKIKKKLKGEKLEKVKEIVEENKKKVIKKKVEKLEIVREEIEDIREEKEDEFKPEEEAADLPKPEEDELLADQEIPKPEPIDWDALDIPELYQEALRLEEEIREQYAELLASELAEKFDISEEEARELVVLPDQETPDMSGQITEASAALTDATGLEAYSDILDEADRQLGRLGNTADQMLTQSRSFRQPPSQQQASTAQQAAEAMAQQQAGQALREGQRGDQTGQERGPEQAQQGQEGQQAGEAPSGEGQPGQEGPPSLESRIAGMSSTEAVQLMRSLASNSGNGQAMDIAALMRQAQAHYAGQQSIGIGGPGETYGVGALDGSAGVFKPGDFVVNRNPSLDAYKRYAYPASAVSPRRMSTPTAQPPDGNDEANPFAVVEEQAAAPSATATPSTSAGDSRPAGWVYLNKWYIVGPFENRGDIDFRQAFPPEVLFDLDASYRGKGGKTVSWEYVHSESVSITPPDLHGESAYYAYTELFFEDAADLWIAVGSDDALKVWINDLVVFESTNTLHSWQVNEGIRKVHFKQGRNRVMIRVENRPTHCRYSFLILPDDVGFDNRVNR